MKYIEKTESEQEMFDEWRKAGGWEASFRDRNSWKSKAEHWKHQVLELLLKEQKYLCCYCEERITGANSHIEHLQPRSQFPKLKQTYSNLLCSCNYGKSCGRIKDRWAINVSPLQKTCEDVFVYDDNGKVAGKNQDATDTIRVLQLNCERLSAARRMILDVFLNTRDITVSEYDDWIDDYLKPDSRDRFRPFWTAVQFIAQKYRPCVE